MQKCSVENCENLGVFKTRTRPTWCQEHLDEIYENGGLLLIDIFTTTNAYLLTQCIECDFKAHYRFEYVLERNYMGERVCRACYWREWANGSRSISGIDQIEADIDSIRASVQQHGFLYLEPLTVPSFQGDPHAVQCQRCGRISALRTGDIEWGCTCSRNPKSASTGTKRANGANLLRNSSSEKKDWWDHEKNSEDLWLKAKGKSRCEAWWRCPDGHSFAARVADVTRERFECPICTENRRKVWNDRRLSIEGKTIADIPELLEAWEEDIDPSSVLASAHAPGSGYKLRCPKGHTKTQQPIAFYQGGCPSCRMLATKAEHERIARQNPDSSRLTPEISSQWHPTKNGKLKLATISPESRRQVWWRDPLCGHEFEATPRERDKYRRLRCPICDTILDSLAYHYPEIAEEWSPKNPMSPWHVRPNASTLNPLPLWQCKVDPDHEWRASPGSRVAGSQCPQCKTAGKSRIELSYFNEAKVLWDDVASGQRVTSKRFSRRGSWEVDILVNLPNGETLYIEYDGWYWHRDKVSTDQEKSMELLREATYLVRIREEPLDSLRITESSYLEVFVKSDAQDPHDVLSRICEFIANCA